jgi:hypothetical protein
MAIEQHPAARPDVEMAQPELLVDQAEQFESVGALGVGHADFRQAQQLQHAVLGAPDAAHLVFRPAALDFAADLVVADVLAGPAVGLEQLREHFHRRGVVFAGYWFTAGIHAGHPISVRSCASHAPASRRQSIGNHAAIGENPDWAVHKVCKSGLPTV